MRIATEKDTVATKPTFPGLPTEIHRLIYEELFSDKKEQRMDHPSTEGFERHLRYVQAHPAISTATAHNLSFWFRR